jgi:hypothetical protein
MTPERLVREGTPFDRRLLQAARAELPATGAEERALAAIGALRASNAGDATGRGEGAGAGTVLAAKAAVVAVVVAALGAMGAHSFRARRAHRVTESVPVRSSTEALSSSTTARPVPPEASGVATAPLAATSSRAPAASAASPDAPASVATASRLVPRAPTRPTASETRCDLALESSLVQEATRALARHDAASAIRALDAHDARCARPILAQEAGLLRVRALVAGGRRAEARALAEHLRDADPQGVLAPSLDAVLDESTTP